MIGLHTGMLLRPGEVIDFTVSAIDPKGQPLDYSFNVNRDVGYKWQSSNTFQLVVGEFRCTRLSVDVYIKSNRKDHAHESHDDSAEINYTVLPSVVPLDAAQ